MKSSKFRLITSIVCLVAAIALASFAVFAWFTTMTTAKTNGFEVDTTSGDIKSFEITVYKATSADGVSYTQGEEASKEDGKWKMEDYSPRSTGVTCSDTAILIEMKITFNPNPSASKFSLNASISTSDPYPGFPLVNPADNPTVDNSDKFEDFKNNNYLSNAIFFKSVKYNGTTKTYDVEKAEGKELKYTFVESITGSGDDKKIEKSQELKSIEYSSSTETIYFIMDYEPAYIDALYTIMLQKFPTLATLNTKIIFDNDIIFTVGESNENTL